MIKHIVMWRLNNRADAPRIKEAIEAMRGKIPGLTELEVGINFCPDQCAADLALYSTFENRGALEAYATHPVHIPVKRFVAGLVAKRWVVDYEI
jgi:hypothetical protein